MKHARWERGTSSASQMRVTSQWEVTNQLVEASLVVGTCQEGFTNLEYHASLGVLIYPGGFSSQGVKPDNNTKPDNGVLKQLCFSRLVGSV